MNYSEILEKYLYRIARDELSEVSDVLPLLRKSLIYVLASSTSSALPNDNSSPKVDLQLPLRKKAGHSLVPVFLNKTRNFQPQPYGSYEFYEILGESLLQVLPQDHGIIIEPMTSLEVIFSPEMIHTKKEIVTNNISTETSVGDSHEESSLTEINSEHFHTSDEVTEDNSIQDTYDTNLRSETSMIESSNTPTVTDWKRVVVKEEGSLSSRVIDVFAHQENNNEGIDGAVQTAKMSDTAKVRYLMPSDFKSEESQKTPSFGDNINLDIFSNEQSDHQEIKDVYHETVSSDLSEYDLKSADNLVSHIHSEDEEEKIRIAPRRRVEPQTNIVEDSRSLNDISQDTNNEDFSEIEEKLLEIVKRFTSIQEAYTVAHPTDHSERVMGVLSDIWNADERFQLTEAVARISQVTYGYAGAIILYDDLHDIHSSSWELFKMMSPFYVKELDQKEASNSVDSLSSQIEKMEDKGILKSSVNKITRTGFRLFGR